MLNCGLIQAHALPMKVRSSDCIFATTLSSCRYACSPAMSRTHIMGQNHVDSRRSVDAELRKSTA